MTPTSFICKIMGQIKILFFNEDELSIRLNLIEFQKLKLWRY